MRSGRDRENASGRMGTRTCCEIPSDALDHFDASVEHLVDERDARRDAPLGIAEENTHEESTISILSCKSTSFLLPVS